MKIYENDNNLIREGEWIQVIGTFKSLGSSKSVNVLSLKKITDYNQITFHFLEAITSSLASADPSFIVSRFFPFLKFKF